MADFGVYDPNVSPLDPRDPIPTGWYTSLVFRSDVKPNSNKNGDRAIFDFVVLEGPCEKAEFSAGLNIRHPAAKVQEIAQRELKSICEAVGVTAPTKTEQLENIPLWVKVELEPGNTDATGKTWPPKNVPKDYRSMKEGPGRTPLPTEATKAEAPAAPTPSQPVTTQPTTNSPGPKPWQRK